MKKRKDNKANAAFLAVAGWIFFAAPAVSEEGAQGRGKYVFDAAGCAGCHTKKKDGAFLAGGRALKTPFGVFYSPNITPDTETGIGTWSQTDFIRALRHGISPAGDFYFPSFPYPSYTNMAERDMRDLRAYLLSVKAVRQKNKAHELTPPFGWRFLLTFWRALYFSEGPPPDPLDRGGYLARALGHCGECHTPRNLIGGPKRKMYLAGSEDGPLGFAANLTPDRDTGIGKWSKDDLDTFFRMGMLPDGDFAGGKMGEIITNTTSKLTKDDLNALIGHLRNLAPVINAVRPEKAKSKETNEW